MTNFSRKSLIGTFALVASLSAPLAFAQSTAASAQANPPTGMTAQPEAATQSTNGAAAPAANASPKKSWADIDGNKDGKLSKAEAAAVPALGQVFDQADGNIDGSLTADEYKTYVAKVQSEGSAGGGTK